MKRVIALLFAITVMLMIGGCGSYAPLTGKITFEDGSPLTTGTVVFDDGARIARGTIQNDGSYTVGFDKETNGIPKGEYRVYVYAAENKVLRTSKNSDGEETSEREEIPLVAKKYMSPDTSGLTFTADGKNNTFDIKVERP